MRGPASEPPGPVSVGHIDVAGHKAGGEPHRSRGFHHEKRKISAGTLSRFQGLDWGLSPGCASTNVGEAVCNRLIECHQKTACRLLAAKPQKAEKPPLQAATRIIALSSDAGCKIGKLV